MCIVLWSTRKESGYVLVIASNRDEFLSRSTRNASWHSFGNENQQESEKDVISGLDLQGGGTWLGFSKRTNRFGFLTNLSSSLEQIEPKNPKWISRGNLLKEYLGESDMNKSLEEFIRKIKSDDEDLMDGYNLVVGQIKDHAQDLILDSHCNRVRNKRNQMHNQEDENGMSNGIRTDVEEHQWAKVNLGKRLLTKRMLKEIRNGESNQEKLIDDLFKILSQTDPTNQALSQNILIRPYHRLTPTSSSLPNQQTWYGTKTQTLILVSKTQKVTFIERDGFGILSDPTNPIGSPVWLGDDRNAWRRFEFEIE